MRNENQSFADVIRGLKDGSVAWAWRTGWNGKDIWIGLQTPDEKSANTLPYLYLQYRSGHPKYPDGARVPWLASQTDMLENDWTTDDGTVAMQV